MGKEAAVRKYIAAAPGDINKLDAKGRTYVSSSHDINGDSL